MENKNCKICNEEFTPNTGNQKICFKSECKKQQKKIYQKRDYAKRKDVYLKNAKNWAEKNKDKSKEMKNAHREKMKIECPEYFKSYYKNNKKDMIRKSILKGKELNFKPKAISIEVGIYGTTWTDEEDRELLDLKKSGASYEDIAIALKRTVYSCRTRHNRLLNGR